MTEQEKIEKVDRPKQRQALIDSINKYNYWIAKRSFENAKEYEDCSLCDYAEEINWFYSCVYCLMDNRWPSAFGFALRCTYKGSCWQGWLENSTTGNVYDGIFFAKILIESFHERLRELYR